MSKASSAEKKIEDKFVETFMTAGSGSEVDDYVRD